MVLTRIPEKAQILWECWECGNFYGDEQGANGCCPQYSPVDAYECPKCEEINKWEEDCGECDYKFREDEDKDANSEVSE